MDKIVVKDIDINYKKQNEEDYISLTDIAKSKNAIAPADVVKNWMRTRSAIEYMSLWEKFYNHNSNLVEIDQFINDAGSHSFTMSPTRWIESVNAIGIISKSGKYGGTYAHKDIAFKFASWISTEFEFYLIKEFQRLKENEQKQLGWSAKRELAKINYRIHTDAINEFIIPVLSPNQISFAYANEADVLNMALFGMTAAEWCNKNTDKKGNIRDYASINELICLSNMENINAIFIQDGMSQSERLTKLNQVAISQMKVLSENIGRQLLK